MRGNKSRDTKPEMALRRAVHALGLRYRVSIRPLAQRAAHDRPGLHEGPYGRLHGWLLLARLPRSP